MSLLTIRNDTSETDPRMLHRGQDLVVSPSWADGVVLPAGVVLDDFLDADAREAADASAVRDLSAWRRSNATELVTDGVDLGHACEVELLADAFIRAESLKRGLTAALSDLAPTEVRLAGLDRGASLLVRAICAEVGVGVVTAAQTDLARPARAGSGSVLSSLVALTGAPSRVRGRVVCVPYWHLVPVYERLAELGGRVRPVAGATLLPFAPRAALLAAARGGWVGSPSGRARSRARDAVRRRLETLSARAPTDAAGAAVHQAALDVLRRDGPGVVAVAARSRRALRTGRARLLVLPWDSPEYARALIDGAAGTPSLVVQHGFDARLGDPDKLGADHVAVWSERDKAMLERLGRDPTSISVTGNPGATSLAAPAARAPERGSTVILVEYPSRLSCVVDARVGARHVRAALEGLASARPGTQVVIRPHPSDAGGDTYVRLGAEHPGLRVHQDSQTPIEALLHTADLCIGAISTATLQADALGIPTVFLDVTGTARPWPFDGAPDALPRATSPAELADAVATALASGKVAGEASARDALGARPDAVERVVELIAAMAG